MRYIKWVVKPEILLRRRFEGTTAYGDEFRGQIHNIAL